MPQGSVLVFYGEEGSFLLRPVGQISWLVGQTSGREHSISGNLFLRHAGEIV